MKVTSVHMMQRGVLVTTRSFPDRWPDPLVSIIRPQDFGFGHPLYGQDFGFGDPAYWPIMVAIGSQVIEESKRMFPHYRALNECGVVLLRVYQRLSEHGRSLATRCIIQEFDFLWATPKLPEPWEWK